MIRFVKHGIKKAYAALALLSIEIIVLLGVFSAALFAFVGIAKMIFKEKKETFDQRSFNFLAKYVSDINTDVMIPSGLTNYPILTADTEIRSLRMFANVPFVINAGIKLDINGRL